jgi:hypothetical protein
MDMIPPCVRKHDLLNVIELCVTPWVAGSLPNHTSSSGRENKCIYKSLQ